MGRERVRAGIMENSINQCHSKRCWSRTWTQGGQVKWNPQVTCTKCPHKPEASPGTKAPYHRGVHSGPTTLFVCVHDKSQRIPSYPARFDNFGEMISHPFQLSLDRNGQLPVISGTSSIGCWLKGEPFGLFEVNMQHNVDVVPARPAKIIAGSRADHKTIRSVL